MPPFFVLSPKAWWRLGGALVLALALVLGVNAWRARQVGRNAVAKHDVAQQRVVVQKQEDTVSRDTAALTRADSVLTRVVTRWRVDTVRLAPLPTRGAVDSGRVSLDSVFRAMAGARVRGDSLALQLDTTTRACSAYRDTCRKTTADLLELQRGYRGLSVAYQRLVDTPAPRRRWGLGCTGGYGAVASGGRGYVGPGAACGLAFSF